MSVLFRLSFAFLISVTAASLTARKWNAAAGLCMLFCFLMFLLLFLYSSREQSRANQMQAHIRCKCAWNCVHACKQITNQPSTVFCSLKQCITPVQIHTKTQTHRRMCCKWKWKKVPFCTCNVNEEQSAVKKYQPTNALPSISHRLYLWTMLALVSFAMNTVLSTDWVVPLVLIISRIVCIFCITIYYSFRYIPPPPTLFISIWNVC